VLDETTATALATLGVVYSPEFLASPELVLTFLGQLPPVSSSPQSISGLTRPTNETISPGYPPRL
jgi:hypothetical protein